MAWVKRHILGKGTYGTVFLAEPTLPIAPPIAIKSSPVSTASSLQLEERILGQLQGCPEIVSYFGSTVTVENGTRFYNLLLEYAAGGTLSDLIEKGSCLCEWNVSRYVSMILRGLCFLHGKGIVHCDLIPSNILVFSDDRLKIADFGFVKQGRDYNDEIGFWRFRFRGTPFYMSPESFAFGEIGAPLDIWSLVCIVVEMVTGKPLWWKYRRNLSGLKFRLAFVEQSPGIPEGLSENGKDFLRKCFERDPTKRWTAEMLLNHPFVSKSRSMYRKTPEPSYFNHCLSSSDGAPLPGWCSFTPSDQNSEEWPSLSSSASLPPPGWCSFTPSDQNSEESLSLSSSASLPPPGWCSFSCPHWTDPAASLPPPGWCSFSSTDSGSSICGSPDQYNRTGEAAVL